MQNSDLTVPSNTFAESIPIDYGYIEQGYIPIFWGDNQVMGEDNFYQLPSGMVENQTLHVPKVCRFIYTYAGDLPVPPPPPPPSPPTVYQLTVTNSFWTDGIPGRGEIDVTLTLTADGVPLKTLHYKYTPVGGQSQITDSIFEIGLVLTVPPTLVPHLTMVIAFVEYTGGTNPAFYRLVGYGDQDGHPF